MTDCRLPYGTFALEIDIAKGDGVEYGDGEHYIKLHHDGAAIFVKMWDVEADEDYVLTSEGARRLAHALLGFADLLDGDWNGSEGPHDD